MNTGIPKTSMDIPMPEGTKPPPTASTIPTADDDTPWQEPLPPTLLGKTISSLPVDPWHAILETVEAPRVQAGASYLVRLSVPEFTSLCPVTGQPDFAHIVIDYQPARLLIESKALKLFMGSFRNHGAFHETTTHLIGNMLCEALIPHWMRVSAYWFPRGGIPIDVFWQTAQPPAHLYVPPIDIPVYRAR